MWPTATSACASKGQLKIYGTKFCRSTKFWYKKIKKTASPSENFKNWGPTELCPINFQLGVKLEAGLGTWAAFASTPWNMKRARPRWSLSVISLHVVETNSAGYIRAQFEAAIHACFPKQHYIAALREGCKNKKVKKVVRGPLCPWPSYCVLCIFLLKNQVAKWSPWSFLKTPLVP